MDSRAPPTLLAPLAAEILDFWFTPRAGEPPACETPDAQRPPHTDTDRLPRAAEGAPRPPIRAARVVWFRKNDAFDREIRERFGTALAAGIAGAFGAWCTTPLGALARVVLLDQFTRNAFRGTPEAFAGDPGALATAQDAIERGFDRSLDPYERQFLYLPFEHSELLSMQERAFALFSRLAADTGLDAPLPWVERHLEAIRRFGRFPHRNEILGRASTAEELAFLEQPGSRF